MRTNSTTLQYTKPPKITIDWSCKNPSVIFQGVCGGSYVIAPLDSIQNTANIYGMLDVRFLSIQEVLSCAGENKGC